MTLEQFSLMLYDTYQMDISIGRVNSRWRGALEQDSLQKWAIDEIIRYVSIWLWPKAEDDILTFVEATKAFVQRMKRYGGFQNNPASKHFQVAENQARYVLDLLNAMQ